MVRPAIRRTLFAVLAVLVVPLGVAAPAQAAKAPRASVSITAPSNGSSGPADVTVSGKATVPSLSTLRLTVSTVGESVRLTPDSRGAWSTRLTGLVLGPSTICAEIYDNGGGYVTGSCVRYTVTPSPDRFTLTSPSAGAQVTAPVRVGGACEYDELVQVTTDTGTEASAYCDFYTRTWEVLLSGLPFGPVTVTATANAPGVGDVATRVVRVEVVPLPAPSVAIVDPGDGGTLYLDRASTVSGTATGTDYVQVTADGVGIGGAVPQDGAWSIDWFPDTAGDTRLCATGSNTDGASTSCVDVHVSPDPERFGVSLADGLVTNVPDLEVSGSCARGTEVVVGSDATGSSATVACVDGNFTTTLVGLPDGTQTVTATMTYAGSVVASRSATVTVDTTGPATPVVTSPVPGSTVTSMPVTLRGTAEPGVRVEILHSDGIAAAEVAADASGEWAVVLDRDFFQYEGVLTGRRATVRIGVWAFDVVGNPSPATTVTYTTRLR